MIRSFLRPFLLLVLLATSVSIHAQSTSGQISGHVVDPSGANIVGATVQLLNVQTGEVREAKTAESGDFVFPAVQPGQFKVRIALIGFKAYEKENLNLSANERLSAGNITLAVGAQSETVEVQADRTPVQTESGERSALLDSKELSTLMTAGRDVTALLRVLPGVVKDGGGASQLGTQSAGTINGVRGDYNSLSVDGTTGNTRGGPNLDTPMNYDAIGEVKVLLGNYQAEYGQAAGSVVQIVTKSGSKNFHGSAYYYNRNEAFNANDYFNKNKTYVPRPISRYNTIGYNVGGPFFIPGLLNERKDKIFFFFSQEIWPTKKPGTLRQFMMPTALERQGDFSQSVDKSGNQVYIKDPTSSSTTCSKANTSGCFPGNKIPTSRIDPDTQKLMSILPMPNASGTIGGGLYNFVNQGVTKNPVNQQVLRVDYNPFTQLHTYFRGTHMTTTNDGPNAAAVNALMQWGVPFFYSTPSRNATLNVTYIPTPTLINELNVGFASWNETTGLSNSADIAKFQKDKLGINLGQYNPAINPLKLVPRASFAGSTGFSIANSPSILFDNRFPLSDDTRSWQVTDGITKVFNRHTPKAGIYYQKGLYIQRHTGATFDGQFAFDTNSSNPNDTGYAYANAVAGYYNSYTEGSNTADYAPTWKVLEWYLQDSWKVVPSLTLEYGVRFSYDLPTTLKPGNGAGYVPSRYNSAKVPRLYTPYQDPKTKTRYAVDPGAGTPGASGNPLLPAVYIGQFVPNSGDYFNGTVVNTDSSYPTSLRYSNGLLVAPRFGFAYSPFNNSKTVVRGGTGLFYNMREGGGTVGDYSLIGPIVINPVQNYGDARQFANNCSGSACSSAGISTISPQDTRILQPNRPLETIFNGTIGIQQAINGGTVIDVAYVGTFGRHLSEQYNTNLVPYLSHFQAKNIDNTVAATTVLGNVSQPVPLNDNFFRPTPGYGAINLRSYSGTSNYHSLQAQLTRRFAKGLQFGVVYTWSKAMTDADAVNGTVATYQNRRFWNYSLASYDRTNNFVVHWLWDLPKGSTLWSNWATKAVLDNWQYSGIAELVSGTPYGITLNTSGIDLTGGGDGARAVVTANPVLPKNKRTVTQYFDTSAFVLPTYKAVPGPDTPGITRNIVFRGPGTNNMDMALNKNVPIREGILFQLRCEAYNVFNHASFNAIDNTARFNTNGTTNFSTFGNLTGDRGPRQLQLSGRINF